MSFTSGDAGVSQAGVDAASLGATVSAAGLFTDVRSALIGLAVSTVAEAAYGALSGAQTGALSPDADAGLYGGIGYGADGGFNGAGMGVAGLGSLGGGFSGSSGSSGGGFAAGGGYGPGSN